MSPKIALALLSHINHSLGHRSNSISFRLLTNENIIFMKDSGLKLCPNSILTFRNCMWGYLCLQVFEGKHLINILGPYSLTWTKLREKSAQDQIRIKENGSADLWLKSVFTKEGSLAKIWKNFTSQRIS